MKNRAVFCVAIVLGLAGAAAPGLAQSTVLYTEDFEAWSGVFDNDAQYTNEFAVTTSASGGTWSYSPVWPSWILSNAPTSSQVLNLVRPGNQGGMSSAAIALDPGALL